MYSSLIVLLVALTGSVITAPSIGVYPRANIGILPIVECPDDDIVSVIIAPSVAGQELAANQYVVCFKGAPHIFNCSEGLFFNWSTMSCDFPYERSTPGVRSSGSNGTSPIGDLDLIPAGPIQVPISPQYPIPIWTRIRGGNVYPVPPYPVTKPDPSVIVPLPVLPAHPYPPVVRPIPYYYY